MKKYLKCTITILTVLFLVSCNNRNNSLENTSNLNLENAILNTECCNDLYQLSLTPKEVDTQELSEYFIQYTEDILNKKISPDDILIQYYNGKSEPLNNYSVLNEDLFSICNYSKEYDSSYTFNTSFFQFYYRNSDFQGADKIYFVNSMDENFVNASETLKNITNDYSYFFNNDKITLSPFYYEKYDDGIHYKYSTEYKDIKFDTNYYASIEDTSQPLYLANNYIEVFLDSNNCISLLKSYYNWDIMEEKVYTDYISFDEAQQIISKNLTDEHVFYASRVDMIYKINEELYEKGMPIKWKAEPYWKVTIDKSGIPDAPSLALLVNAITGEFECYQIIL